MEQFWGKTGLLLSYLCDLTFLWEDDCYVEENTLTVNVTRLRKKLEQAGLKDFITTRVGHGYLIELPEEHE